MNHPSCIIRLWSILIADESSQAGQIDRKPTLTSGRLATCSVLCCCWHGMICYWALSTDLSVSLRHCEPLHLAHVLHFPTEKAGQSNSSNPLYYLFSSIHASKLRLFRIMICWGSCGPATYAAANPSSTTPRDIVIDGPAPTVSPAL